MQFRLMEIFIHLFYYSIVIFLSIVGSPLLFEKIDKLIFFFIQLLSHYSLFFSIFVNIFFTHIIKNQKNEDNYVTKINFDALLLIVGMFLCLFSECIVIRPYYFDQIYFSIFIHYLIFSFFGAFIYIFRRSKKESIWNKWTIISFAITGFSGLSCFFFYFMGFILSIILGYTDTDAVFFSFGFITLYSVILIFHSIGLLLGGVGLIIAIKNKKNVRANTLGIFLGISPISFHILHFIFAIPSNV